MAELIGVTYQQAHKYETGINRISAGRLYQIARALGVEISYFFEDVEPGSGVTRTQELMPQQRMLLELARNFAAIKSRKHQEALCHLARVLSGGEARHGGRGRAFGGRCHPGRAGRPDATPGPYVPRVDAGAARGPSPGLLRQRRPNRRGLAKPR